MAYFLEPLLTSGSFRCTGAHAVYWKAWFCFIFFKPFFVLCFWYSGGGRRGSAWQVQANGWYRHSVCRLQTTWQRRPWWTRRKRTWQLRSRKLRPWKLRARKLRPWKFWPAIPRTWWRWQRWQRRQIISWFRARWHERTQGWSKCPKHARWEWFPILDIKRPSRWKEHLN